MDFVKKALLGKELYIKCQSKFATDSEIETRLKVLSSKGLNLTKDELLGLCNLNETEIEIDDKKLNDIYYSENKENLFCRILKLNCSNENDLEEIKRLAKLENEQVDHLGEYPSLSLVCEYRDKYVTDIHNNFYYVALRKGSDGSEIICAVMMVVPTDHFLKIAYLTSRAHSDPEYKGVGRMLINNLIDDYYYNKNYIGIWLESSNGAHEFYQKLGFKPDSHKFYYYYLFPSIEEVLERKIKMDITNDIDLLIENSNDILIKELFIKGFLSNIQLEDIRNSPGLYNDLFKIIPIDEKHIDKLFKNYTKNDYRLLITYIKNGIKLHQSTISSLFDYYINLRQKVSKNIRKAHLSKEDIGEKMLVGVDTNFIKILNALEETGYKFDRDNIIRLSYLTGPKKFEEILLKFQGNKEDFITILNSVSGDKNKEILTNLIEKISNKGCVIQ